MSKFLTQRLQSFAAYTPGEQPKNAETLIKLNTNESPYPPSPKAMEALTKTSIEDLRLYSDLSASALISALSEDLQVPRDQIICGNGSDEIIYFAMLAFGTRGVSFADITYGFYDVWAKVSGFSIQILPLDQGFNINPEDYTTNDRMVIIANPNAPTGIALPQSAIETIVNGNPDQVVLIDEAYVDFGGESAIPLIEKYDNLLISRTFSKSRQMAGARLGFALGNAELIRDLNKIRYSINPYNVNSLTQALGTASIKDKDYFDWTRSEIIRTREYTVEALGKLGFSVMPSSCNFVFAKPPRISGKAYQDGLRQRNIFVRRFELARIENYLRITIGSMPQMKRLIEATKELICS